MSNEKNNEKDGELHHVEITEYYRLSFHMIIYD